MAVIITLAFGDVRSTRQACGESPWPLRSSWPYQETEHAQTEPAGKSSPKHGAHGNPASTQRAFLSNAHPRDILNTGCPGGQVPPSCPPLGESPQSHSTPEADFFNSSPGERFSFQNKGVVALASALTRGPEGSRTPSLIKMVPKASWVAHRAEQRSAGVFQQSGRRACGRAILSNF